MESDSLKKELTEVLDGARKESPSLVRFDANIEGDGQRIYLSKIEVAAGARNQGIGTAAMKELARFADNNNLLILLTPEADGRNKGALRKFYQKLGFVENKGRHRDSQLSSMFAPTMYRRAEDVIVLPGPSGLASRAQASGRARI